MVPERRGEEVARPVVERRAGQRVTACLAAVNDDDGHAALGGVHRSGTPRTKVVPTLVIHGDSDATVPLEGSGARTHVAIPHSQLVVVPEGPHGVNVSHADAFNTALLEFLRS